LKKPLHWEIAWRKNINMILILLLSWQAYSIFYKIQKKTLQYVDRVLEINEHDTDALGLKLRVHQHLKENSKVIECCKKILEIDSDAYDVRTILNELEGK